MNIALAPKTHKLLKDRMKRGGYRSPDDVVRAALAYLEQQEHAGDFEPAELEKLLQVSDDQNARGELHDGQEVFQEIRNLAKQPPKRRPRK